MKFNILLVFPLFVFSQCTQYVFTPKPYAYSRINLPIFEKYESFVNSCPYQFEYPNYVTAKLDSFYFGEEITNDCWLNLEYPDLNGTVHISYKEIGKEITLEKIMEDSYELTYTHTKKADFIDEYTIKNQHGVEGLMYDVGGDAATNVQFFLTDYEQNYLRGSLYFNSKPNADSIAPAVNFIKSDLLHLFETFKWK